MKEKYINEMSQVHAPKELIEKTKLAMRDEKQKQKKERNKSILMRYVPIAATVAAAVLILMLAPNFGKQTDLYESTDVTQSEIIQSELMLERLDLIPSKITPDSSELGNVETFIIDHYPEEFLSEFASEKEIEGILIRLVKDEKTGFYKAVFTWETKKILVVSEILETDRMVGAVKEVIQALAAQTKE